MEVQWAIINCEVYPWTVSWTWCFDRLRWRTPDEACLVAILMLWLHLMKRQHLSFIYSCIRTLVYQCVRLYLRSPKYPNNHNSYLYIKYHDKNWDVLSFCSSTNHHLQLAIWRWSRMTEMNRINSILKIALLNRKWVDIFGDIIILVDVR